MSEIGGIQPDVNEQIAQFDAAPPSISSPVQDAVTSASSIQELEEMLKIIDNAASSHHPKVTQAIQTIHSKIKDGASLNDIKTSAIR